MGEYGRIVGETSGAAGGSGGGDVGGDALAAFNDLADQVMALPTEVFIVIAAVVLIAGLVLTLRPS